MKLTSAVVLAPDRTQAKALLAITEGVNAAHEAVG